MKLFAVVLISLFSLQLLGQDHYPIDDKPSLDQLHLTFVISHTFLPETTVQGKATMAIPSIGFDIEYFINKRFGLGLHNDLELLVYEVKEDDNTYLKREFPVLLTADLLYSLRPDLILFAGPGIELEKGKNIPVIRMGIEYMAHIGETFTFSPIFSYDHRINSFDSFSIGIGVGFGL